MRRVARDPLGREATFGHGLVSAGDEGRVTVRFDDVGYRTLDLGEVADRELLVPAGLASE